MERSQLTYVCSLCQHEVQSDKLKKRCPNCKKHRLVAQSSARKNDLSQFVGIIQSDSQKVHSIPIDPNRIRVAQNKFDPSEFKHVGHDAQNERLKKLTVRTERARSPMEHIDIKCRECNNVYNLPSSYVISMSLGYLCDHCIEKKVPRNAG